MAMAKWWLVTWTTYATWLPGDPRGFQTWQGREYVPPPTRYAREGEPVYNPKPYEERHKIAKERSEEPVVLTREQQQTVLDALVAEISELPLDSAVLSVGATHVHWLARFGELSIRPTVGRIKAAATRALRASGFDLKRPWTKGCHMKSKNSDRELKNARAYIKQHVNEGCLVYDWDS